MEMTIREAVVDDAEALAAAEKAIAASPGFLISHPDELSSDAFARKIVQLSGSTNGRYVVATENGKIVGHAMLDPMSLRALRHVVRLTLVVHQGSQGRAVGAALLRHLIEWARACTTVEKIELSVRSSNSRAIHLYTKLGFREEGRLTGRIKIDDTQYLDDIAMGLWVKPFVP
jgi:ribosomal protein S18 acetylase RimI-like enzyme